MIRNLAKRKAFVNHYSFHIMEPHWGHVTIKMSGYLEPAVLTGDRELAVSLPFGVTISTASIFS